MSDESSWEPEELLASGLAEVDFNSSSGTKFARLEYFLSSEAKVRSTKVAAIQVSKASEVVGQLKHSVRVENAELAVVVVTSDAADKAIANLRDYLGSSATPAALLILQKEAVWRVGWLGKQIDATSEAAENLAKFFKVELKEVVATVTRVPAHPLVIDKRINRMLRLAVKSSKSVMLVGPPGTGKTQLVGELVADIGKDPYAFGMGLSHDPLFVTPDESWTTRDLVGGNTVDDQSRLRFSPGHVLEAIAQDRWLVLDEANRADLDRIFGGLLTWLSGKEVTVGRATADPQSSPIILGWNSHSESRVIGEARLRSNEKTADPIYYLAGNDWRLLGTYNAVDAQRVFRFGQALGRRFAHVPVPAPTSSEFVTALNNRIDATTWPLAEQNADRLRGVMERIYSAQVEHLDPMGPAALLDIVDYVAAGLHAESDFDLQQLVAEGYLAGLGSWLAANGDKTLDQLGAVLSKDEVLGSREWRWMRNQLRALR